MASDEGMNPWFYSDGNNLNFSSLSLLTAQDLRMQNLGPDFLSTITRLAPSDHAEFLAGTEYPDIEAVGYDLDYLAIEEEFNGLFTELEDEEFEDYVSETADEAVINF